MPEGHSSLFHYKTLYWQAIFKGLNDLEKIEIELKEQNSNPIIMQYCNYTRGLSSLHPGIKKAGARGLPLA